MNSQFVLQHCIFLDSSPGKMCVCFPHCSPDCITLICDCCISHSKIKLALASRLHQIIWPCTFGHTANSQIV